MILVTGSSGTIGNRLCEELEDNNIEYIGVDKRKNIWNEKVSSKTIIMDLKNPENLTQLIGNIDIIIHLAANARVFKLVQNPDLAKDNFLTFYNICEFARHNKIGKLIFSSSREVYGNSGLIVHNEDESYVNNCESSYTATKIGAEALLHAYNQCYGLDIIILRFSNVYGRYDFSDRVIPQFILMAKNNEDLIIYGKNKILDFTYVDDTVNGIMQSIMQFNNAKNNTYNIATGKGRSLEHVAQYIIDKTKSKSKIFFKKNRMGEVIQFIADIDKAKDNLSYVPKFDLESGINNTIKWYLPRLEEYMVELAKNS